jgi:uncharacterized protein (DUF2147 family)
MGLRHWIACGLLPALPVHAATPAPIFGHWVTDDRTAIIRIEPCGAQLCGTIERVLNPKAPPNDINNPDPVHRTQPLVGARVLSGFSGSGAHWQGGLAYDPKAGRSYRSQLTLESANRLRVTGCVLFICKSLTWSRIGG